MRHPGLRLAVLGILVALTTASCNLFGMAVANPAMVKLTGRVVVTVAKDQRVKLFVADHLGQKAAMALDTATSVAEVLGVYPLGGFGEREQSSADSQYLVINHLVDHKPVTTAVRIKDKSPLAVKVKGEADLYLFREGRVVIDALTTTQTEITVFDPEQKEEVFARGEVGVGYSGAVDLDSGTSLVVDDPQFLPARADLVLHGAAEKEPTLINGATAASRGEVPLSKKGCSALPASVWRGTLSFNGHGGDRRTWCIKTAEGSYGAIRQEQGGGVMGVFTSGVYSYELWTR